MFLNINVPPYEKAFLLYILYFLAIFYKIHVKVHEKFTFIDFL